MTHFDFEDDCHTGCRNVSHFQQQSSSGLRVRGYHAPPAYINYSRFTSTMVTALNLIHGI